MTWDNLPQKPAWGLAQKASYWSGNGHDVFLLFPIPTVIDGHPFQMPIKILDSPLSLHLLHHPCTSSVIPAVRGRDPSENIARWMPDNTRRTWTNFLSFQRCVLWLHLASPRHLHHPPLSSVIPAVVELAPAVVGRSGEPSEQKSRWIPATRSGNDTKKDMKDGRRDRHDGGWHKRRKGQPDKAQLNHRPISWTTEGLTLHGETRLLPLGSTTFQSINGAIFHIFILLGTSFFSKNPGNTTEL